ncbi:MAG: hypothetical protein ACRDA3_15195 [Peptostreptococcaceae bacterium]
MEIKINLNIDITNFNQIIETLHTLINKETKLQNTVPSRNKEDLIELSINSQKQNISLPQIRENLSYLMNNGKMLVAQQLLKKYNAEKIVDIKEEDYENLYKDIINQIN